MTPGEIAAVAKQAGFKGVGLAWAVAVSLAESGGRPDAVNVNKDGSRDRGLWQINDKAHPNVSDAQAFNPATAAQAAYAISSGGSRWTPWNTYAPDNRNFDPNGPAARDYSQGVAAAGNPAAAPTAPTPGAGLPAGAPTWTTMAALDSVAESTFHVPFADLSQTARQSIYSGPALKQLAYAASQSAQGNVSIPPWNPGGQVANLLQGYQQDAYIGAVYIGVLALGAGLIIMGAAALARNTSQGAPA
jgi:hypothetical protein